MAGHRSHQSGRDADVGFYVLDAHGKRVTPDHFIHFDAAGDAQLRIELEEKPRLVEAFFPMTTEEAQEVQRAAAKEDGDDG